MTTSVRWCPPSNRSELTGAYTTMVIGPEPGRLSQERIAKAYADGFWKNELPTDLLAQHARERPSSLAAVDGMHRLSWDELYRQSIRLALHLRALGLERGDVVAVQLPNWVEYLICYYGVLLAGGVVVQPGADWRSVEMAYGLGIGPARTVVIPGDFGDFDYPQMIAVLRTELPALEHVLVARGQVPAGCVSLDELRADPIEARVAPSSLDSLRPGPDEVVRVVFTSGTTGLPKAIKHTSNTFAHSSRTLIDAFGFSADDVIYMYVPLSTNYGAIMGLALHAATGATAVYADRFSASGSLALIERERVSFLPGTPTAFIAMLNSPAISRHDLGSLRVLLSAGASFPVQAINELRDAISAPFIESFGMNEFGMGFWYGADDDLDAVTGSIGRPIAGLEARIVDEHGRDVAPGETGELLVKSAGMCAGYHANPEANAAAWDAADWFHSGDLARTDEAGNYRIVGRSKDVIIRGGANVSPREIEEVLASEPRIREVSVIGLPDTHYGETVCACVILREGQTIIEQEIAAFLEPRLASYKLPAKVVFLQTFPLNSMGKVRKDELRRIVMDL